MRSESSSGLRVAGLFAGIGGIEVGLHRAGHRTELLCEIDPSAQAVLATHFPGIRLAPDVTQLAGLPRVDVVAGGFPCQDLSQAGQTAGIKGRNSGLVSHIFRLISRPGWRPQWLLLENVPFMLQLDHGEAMRFLTHSLDELGFFWAYRVVDSRAFGLPQRRQRVILLASKVHDPRTVLFADEAGELEVGPDPSLACGFFWTEGIRGLGWAVDAIPTLKGGSTLGIPSPPAILFPDGRVGLPELRDAERLQGFPAEWTLPAEGSHHRRGHRWKLVGNAVSVPVFEWVGSRLSRPGTYDGSADKELVSGKPWPKAAWGRKGKVYSTTLSAWPIRRPRPHLHDFLQFPVTPLSTRATAGFLGRTDKSSLHFPDGFLDALRRHLERMESTRKIA